MKGEANFIEILSNYDGMLERGAKLAMSLNINNGVHKGTYNSRIDQRS